MGVFISYLLQVSVIMAVLYACYKMSLSSSTFHSFNRVALLCIIVASWLLPLAVPDTGFLAGFLSGTEPVMDNGHLVEIGIPIAVQEGDAVSETLSASHFWTYLPVIYILGFVFFIILLSLSVVRLARTVGGGEKRQNGLYTLVVSPAAAGPFSWGRYVVVRPSDCDSNLDLVLNHELRHLQLFHWMDLLVAQFNALFLWFNPAAYLLMRELKCTHEYEVDSAIEPRLTHDYQLMLIKKTVGSSFPTFADSLNHSQLKKRITMMTKRKSSSVRLLAALVLPCAAVAAVSALSLPAVAGIIADVSASSLKSQISGKFTDNLYDRQIPANDDAVYEGAAGAVQAKTHPGGTDTSEDTVEPVIAEDVKAIKAIAGDKDSSGKETYFIDGVRSDAKAVEGLDPNSIKSITVVKNDPDYPKGKILIFTDNEPTDRVYKMVEKIPEFNGGTKALMEFLMQNVKYPEGLAGDCRSVVQFTVSKEGDVSDFKVVKSGGEAADAEAIRAISLTSGKWQPGYNDGKPVSTMLTLPVVFRKK
jgi:hypothetical protein